MLRLCCMKNVYLWTADIHSALWNTHPLEGFREWQLLSSQLVCTLTDMLSPRHVPMERKTMGPSACSSCAISFPLCPSTDLLIPLFLLFPALYILIPLPFSFSPLCRKCKIECLYKYYPVHFHCASRRHALSGWHYYAAHRAADIFSARRELEITLWSSFQIIF